MRKRRGRSMLCMIDMMTIGGIHRDMLYIINKGPRDASKGIMGNVEKLTGITGLELQRIWVTWPSYSGDIFYPVPYTNSSNKAGGYINHPMWAEENLPLWDKSTKYGRARFDLVEFILSACKKKLGAL